MNKNIRNLAAAAVVAAVYAALTMLLAPISYGSVQFRISEALCILPAFAPGAAWGLFIGCAIANLLSPVGLADVVFGSAATLGAALCSAAVARGHAQPLSWPRSAAVCAMPVVWNAAVIGAMLAWVSVPAEAFWVTFAIYAAQVGGGEAAVMFVIGLPLLRFLPRSPAVMRCIESL